MSPRETARLAWERKNEKRNSCKKSWGIPDSSHENTVPGHKLWGNCWEGGTYWFSISSLRRNKETGSLEPWILCPPHIGCQTLSRVGSLLHRSVLSTVQKNQARVDNQQRIVKPNAFDWKGRSATFIIWFLKTSQDTQEPWRTNDWASNWVWSDKHEQGNTNGKTQNRPILV